MGWALDDATWASALCRTPTMSAMKTSDAPGADKHLVFDFGGVLFEWQPHRLLRRTLPRRAHDDASARHWVEQIFQDYAGDWGEFDRGTVEPHELARRIAQRTGLGAQEVHDVVAAVPAELQPIAGTVALLRRLRECGRRLHYLSNMPRPFADHLQREHDIVGWFDGGVFSSRVHHIKPEASIFALAAQAFDAPPASLVLIDDVARNVQAARDCGWNALLFVDAADCERQLRKHGWA